MFKAIFLVLFVNFALALDPNAVINNEMKTSSSDLNNLCDKNYLNTQKLAKACIEKVCGPANKVEPAFLMAEYYDSYDFSKADKEYEESSSKLSKKIESDINNHKLAVDEFIKRLDGDFKFSKQHASEFLLKALDKRISITQNLDENSIKVEIIDLEVSDERKKDVIISFSKNLEAKLATSLELRHKLNLGLNRDDKKQLLINRMLKIDEALISLQKPLSNDQSRLLNFVKQNIVKIEKSSNYPMSLLDGLLKQLDNLKDSLLYVNELVVEEEKFNLCDDKCLEYINSEVHKNDIKEQIIKTKNAYADIDFDGDKIAPACKNLFYKKAYNENMQTKLSLENVMGDVQYAVQSFSRYISKNFSSDTGNELEAKFFNFSNINLMGKSVSNDSQANLDQQLVSIINQENNELDISKINNPTLMNIVFSGPQIIKFVEQHCTGVEHGIKLADDYYDDFFSRINISPYTCNHPVQGRQIIAHELGHVLASLIQKGSSSEESRKKYLAQRKCVSQRHVIPSYAFQNSKKFPEDHVKTEEDMADLLSNLAYSSYQKLGEAQYWEYCKNFPIIGGEYEHIQTEIKEFHAHSPSILRLINAVVDRKVELPTECREFISKRSHVYSPIKCEEISY